MPMHHIQKDHETIKTNILIANTFDKSFVVSVFPVPSGQAGAITLILRN